MSKTEIGILISSFSLGGRRLALGSRGFHSTGER
jgi:hypothetical protein